MRKDTDILQYPQSNVDNTIEQLGKSQIVNSNAICTINDIEALVKNMINSLPKLNKDELRKEMADMVVPMQTTPTTFSINEGLAKSQAYRDRLSEIYIYAQNEYKIKKRCMEMIFDSVNLISKASSADKRRGEATMKYPILVLETEAAELFLKEVEQMLQNMKTTMESVSRQASVLNMQIQLGEVRKPGTNSNQVAPKFDAEEITNKATEQNGEDDGWGSLSL